MKNSIIEKIYFNSGSFSEQVAISGEYKKISDKAYNFYNRLMDMLSDEQKMIFEKFVDSEMGVCAEGEFLRFKEGLKVGLLLAMECIYS